MTISVISIFEYERYEVYIPRGINVYVMTVSFLYDCISKITSAVVATTSNTNEPEAAYIRIAVTKDLKIIFDTVKTSRKYKNLLTKPAVALVIGWENETTIQYEGVARILSDGEKDLFKVYFDTFPEARERKETWQDIVYFCVEPLWIRYSNFNFPRQIEEIFLND